MTDQARRQIVMATTQGQSAWPLGQVHGFLVLCLRTAATWASTLKHARRARFRPHLRGRRRGSMHALE